MSHEPREPYELATLSDVLISYLNRNFGTQIRARIEDPAAGEAIICPHCDLEMSCVFWPPSSEPRGIIVAFTCDPSGRGHWLGVWDASLEVATPSVAPSQVGEMQVAKMRAG